MGLTNRFTDKKHKWQCHFSHFAYIKYHWPKQNQLRIHINLDIVDMSTHFTFYKVHHLKSAK